MSIDKKSEAKNLSIIWTIPVGKIILPSKDKRGKQVTRSTADFDSQYA
jgi:hypothetical protein